MVLISLPNPASFGRYFGCVLAGVNNIAEKLVVELVKVILKHIPSEGMHVFQVTSVDEYVASTRAIAL